MNNFNNKGYAVLFAIVVISIISVIAIGLSNSTQKQLLISSVAKDSRTAFFMADTAVECGLYVDNAISIYDPNQPAESFSFENLNPEINNFNCGLDKNGDAFKLKTNYDQDEFDEDKVVYNINPSILNKQKEPCFVIKVTKNLVSGAVSSTEIEARGYNSCILNEMNTVERAIKVTY